MWLSNVLSCFVTASGVHATPENRRELESGARAYTYLAGSETEAGQRQCDRIPPRERRAGLYDTL